MINYLKSEHYRLLRKKSLYITSGIGFLLIVAAAAVLHYFPRIDPTFPYATSTFFYSNVVAGWVLIMLFALIFNLALTGKDLSVIKQSVSFGISRNTIYWTKLVLTLSYFLLICLVGLLLAISLGENLLNTVEHSVRNFLIACFNMLPIVLSGFFMIHSLRMLNAGESIIIFLMFFIFYLSGNILRALFRFIPGLDELYKYAPNMLLNDNLVKFLNHESAFDYRFWITGFVISALSLLIGVKKFAKKPID